MKYNITAIHNEKYI